MVLHCFANLSHISAYMFRCRVPASSSLEYITVAKQMRQMPWCGRPARTVRPKRVDRVDVWRSIRSKAAYSALITRGHIWLKTSNSLTAQYGIASWNTHTFVVNALGCACAGTEFRKRLAWEMIPVSTWQRAVSTNSVRSKKAVGGCRRKWSCGIYFGTWRSHASAVTLALQKRG